MDIKRLAFWRWIEQLPKSFHSSIPLKDLELVWDQMWDLQSDENLAALKELNDELGKRRDLTFSLKDKEDKSP